MIICEIGVNHLGDEDYADEYVSALVDARPDAVTFQVREPERYQGESAKLLLPETYYQKAARRVKQAGLRFGMALADENKVEFFENLNVDFYKVLSKDILNFSLLDKVLATNKPIFISTGLSDFEEIDKLVEFLGARKKRCALIHTQLTHEIEETQLKAIPQMQKKFQLPVAFGSHSPNPNVLYASIGLEPSDIFFYVKGGRTTVHPDEKHAIKLSDCTAVIANLKELEDALGDGIKHKMKNTITK